MRMPPWWDGARTPIAFLIAPFAVPFMVAFYESWHLRWPSGDFAFGLTAVISLFIAYAGTFLSGLPLYLFLRAQKITAFVLAPVFGLIVGSLAACLLQGRDLTSDFLQLGALSGAVVGAILWLIARPDRPTQ